MIRLDNHPTGRHLLQIPGPSPVPDRVLRAISYPTIDHRGPEFGALGRKVLQGIRAIFKTQHPVVIYPASGMSKQQSKDLAEAFKRAGGGGVDVLYDSVGGDYCEPGLRAMNWNGRYLVIGFPAGIPQPPLNLTLLKSSSIVGVFWGASVAREPELHKANVRDLFKLYSEGTIKPRVSKRYKLKDGGQAIRALMDRKAQGKLVVVME